MDQKKVTMREVAAEAGVSVMTVSLALRNNPEVSVQTAARIQGIAEKMGYRPNPLVSALMATLRPSRNRRQTLSVGFITAFAERDHWREIPTYRKMFEGAAERARQQGFRLDPFWLAEPGMTPARLNQILIARGIQGLMIAPIPQAGGSLNLNWDRFASVAIGYSMARPALRRACNHQSHTMTVALGRLASLGYRRIGLVMLASDDKRMDHNWVAPYLYHHYQVLRQEYLSIGMFDRWDEEKFQAWLEETRPEAVVSTRYFVRNWIEKSGRRIPRDIGFVVLDVGEASEACAGMDQRSEMVGAAAMDLLSGQMYRNEWGIPEHPMLTLVDGEWVDGPTTRQIGDPIGAG